MTTEMENIIKWLGAFGVSATFLGWLTKKLIEWFLNKRLESFKHEQNKELEQIKHNMNALSNRITKSQDKEFEVLPLAWQKLQDALGYISAIVSPVQSYIQLSQMTEQQFRDFVKTSVLLDHEKEQLLNEKDKQQYYNERMFWHELTRAENFLSDFHNYLLYNKIFFDLELFNSFKKMDDLLFNALKQTELGKRFGDHMPIVNSYKEIKKSADPLLEDIEALIQKRLHHLDV